MNRRLHASVVVSLVVASATIAAPALAQVAVSVSPGAVDRIVEVDGRCPAFSWGMIPGAVYFELVAYRLPEMVAPDEANLTDADPALYAEVPGAATSWTPSLEECLAPGARYVWFVRAVYEAQQGHAEEVGEWSEGRFFAIATAPSDRELEQALGVLRRYAVGREGEPYDGAEPVNGSSRSVEAEAVWRNPGPGSATGAKSVTSAKTAIMGTVSEAVGETYGVVGVSGSADGAGLGAANLGGGPDLVLDGSADVETDALLSQGGIFRSSGSAETFTVANPGAGTITLDVQGAIFGDGSGLTSLDAGQITSGTLGSGRLSGTYGEAVSFSNVTSATIAVGTLTDLTLTGTGSLIGATLTGGTFSSGTFSSGVFNSGIFTGTFAGDGSGLTGVGRYLETTTADGCHLVTNASIKSPGIYCPNGVGGEVLCVSNTNENPPVCSSLSDPNCQTFCLDTSSQTSRAATAARPSIPSAGVIHAHQDRLLACHFKGSTLVTLEQKAVCESGSCALGKTVVLEKVRASFVGVTSPSPMWQTLPGTSVAGTGAIDAAGSWSIRYSVVMSAGAPYNSATCYVINRIDDDGATNDNNQIRVFFTQPSDLLAWSP